MKKAYFISGLGADKRVFSLLDLSFCEPVFIDWIAPASKESLESYALRLRGQIKDVSPVIVGISFGGMVLTEMAKADDKIKAIIISSNKLHSEFPGYLNLVRYLPVYRLLPSGLLKKMSLFFRHRLGAKGKQQKKILDQILRDTDAGFLKWAINAILLWRNKIVPANLVHIHGKADKLLPYRLVKADYIIENGSHVMPLDEHKEISELLKVLTDLTLPAPSPKEREGI